MQEISGRWGTETNHGLSFPCGCSPAGEGSAFGVTTDGDSITSIPHKRSKNSISSKYSNWFSHIGVTSQSYLSKIVFTGFDKVEIST